jgi:hypothetical protein
MADTGPTEAQERLATIAEGWIYRGVGKGRERVAIVEVKGDFDRRYLVDNMGRRFGPGTYKVEWKNLRRRYVTSTTVEVAAPNARPRSLPKGRRRPPRTAPPAQPLGSVFNSR